MFSNGEIILKALLLIREEVQGYAIKKILCARNSFCDGLLYGRQRFDVGTKNDEEKIFSQDLL